MFWRLPLLPAYLPQQLSREEVPAEARQVVAETGACGAGDQGTAMPVLVKRPAGKAEDRLINEVVTELLGGRSCTAKTPTAPRCAEPFKVGHLKPARSCPFSSGRALAFSASWRFDDRLAPRRLLALGISVRAHKHQRE